MYTKWERGYIVGEMSEANFLCIIKYEKIFNYFKYKFIWVK